MVNGLSLYSSFPVILTCQSAYTRATFTHTFIRRSVGNLRLSDLPRGTSTCSRRKLESNPPPLQIARRLLFSLSHSYLILLHLIPSASQQQTDPRSRWISLIEVNDEVIRIERLVVHTIYCITIM
ncbi:hypothetical protein XENOCAPTIV_028556 [Xenoophorus captivus]|uniref:Uncharacterized protein n=1 Tax=Xenoophorus captivus TaxID=1517983 RepID=A0ABV0S3M2_9TELE